MARKYINKKREEKEKKWAEKYFKKFRKNSRYDDMSDEALLSNAKHRAEDKWRRRQKMKEIDTYIPIPFKWSQRLREKRRKKGLL
jgi:hypothetical protein